MRFTVYAELKATDINRARDWYRDKLGLEPFRHGGVDLGPNDVLDHVQHDIYYDTGTSRFGIYESWEGGASDATAARFVVDDFEAVYEELSQRGVVFEHYDYEDEFRTVDGVLTSPDGHRTAWFKDSEGNVLAVSSI